jgi:hypothetical protein
MESFEYEASKEPGEDFDGQKESASDGDPTLVVGGEAAAGNDAVEVGMEVQVLAPTMKDAEEPEFQPQTLSSGVEQSLGSGVEEDAVDDLFVVEGQGGDLLG